MADLEFLAYLESSVGAAEFHEGKPLSRDTYWSQVGYWIARDQLDPEVAMERVKSDRAARGISRS